MPQLTVTLEPDYAVAGLVEGFQTCEFETVSLSEDMPADSPGRLVEWDPTDATGRTVRLPQGTTTVMNLAGVLMYNETNEPSVASPGNLGGPWKKGRTVAILRKGRIWAQVVGTAPTPNSATLNVSHSSTVVTDRGKLTATASNVVAGTEIQAGPTGMRVRARLNTPLTAIALVQMNFPA